MAQTTGAISFKDCKIEISTNGSTWTNISGFANSVEVSGGERATAEFFTTDGETPILVAGKRGLYDLSLKVAYTEGASEPFEVLRAAYEAATAVYVRWSPKGGASTNFQYTTSVGVVTGNVYPGGTADTPDVIVIEANVKVNTITKSVVT